MVWRQTGECIRRFHDAGVYHADLNARNILLDVHFKVWLIDFDRAKTIAAGSRKFEANLSRLLRSLQKVWPRENNDLVKCWDSLMAGYNS
jgi:3-deoxy-D-manno-octulosonic acid kinase